MQASLTHAIGKAEKLSTSNIPAFDAGVNSIADDIDQELSAVGFDELDDKYDDESLDDAPKKYSACKSFE